MNKIAHERQKIGLSQSGLARELGWATSRIGNYESGIRTPDLKSCRALVFTLNRLGCQTSLDRLFPPDNVKPESNN